MSLRNSVLALAGLAFLATPAIGQERALVVQALGGGYSHAANLNSRGPAAHFKTGFNLGGALGVQLNKYVAIHGDFTFAQTKALGSVSFVNAKVNRYFVGGHTELRYPMGSIAPFVFAGAGAVVVDQQGPEAKEGFNHFTRVASMFGGGLSFDVPNSPLEILAEGKVLTYKWTGAPFSRTQWDVSYSLGFAYRFGF
jgi:hypothetical protein